MKTTNRFAILLATLVSISSGDRAWSDTFGSGANMFNIEFVEIGNPDNPADTTGNPAPNPAGSVPYLYRIGRFEISEQMIDKANALGGLGITKDTRGPNKPATRVSWNEAARFVNWLNTSTGSARAYKFALQPGEVGYIANADIQLWDTGDAGYNPNNLYRNSLARYFLPSAHEWYKAAYYDPSANGGTGGYWNFPTGSDNAPTPVASGTAAGTAVFDRPFSSAPADITLAGGLSPYGTMGQGGNVWEWEETAFDLMNDSGSSARGQRGGGWANINLLLSSSMRYTGGSPNGSISNGSFRVASSPSAVGLPGDFNRDGKVDAADYVVWRKTDGTPGGYTEWRTNFGQPAGGGGTCSSVPEPATWLSLLVAASSIGVLRRK